MSNPAATTAGNRPNEMIKSWADFIRYLETEIDWYNPSACEQNFRQVEMALKSIAAFPGEIKQRCADIADTPDLFNAYAKHMNYPRILMDKFMLHMDDDDRFRVRIHRFKSKAQNGIAVEKVHSHKWVMSTIILRGSYEEKVFDIHALDEQAGTADLSLKSARRLAPGDTNSLPALVPHQVINHSDNEPAITLFVRGPSINEAARIFDVEAGKFYRTYSPDRQLKEGLLAIGNLDPYFH